VWEWRREDGIEQEIKVVGEDSWFFLEWLVALFEKDAEMTESLGSPLFILTRISNLDFFHIEKHSPLLLRQLPPPPAGSLTRWGASEPLKVVLISCPPTNR